MRLLPASLKRPVKEQGGYFVSEEQAHGLRKTLFHPDGSNQPQNGWKIPPSSGSNGRFPGSC